MFAGSVRAGERISAILTIIDTVKLHGQNPEVYLTDVLARIQDHPKVHAVVKSGEPYRPFFEGTIHGGRALL